MKKIFFSFVLLALILVGGVVKERVNAGGSSFLIERVGKTSFVKSGAILPQAQRLYFQNYFRPEMGVADQLVVEEIRMICKGDNVLRQANLRVGLTPYTSAPFIKKSSKDQKGKNVVHYEAILKPSNFIVDNKSAVLASIDVVTHKNIGTTKIVTCNSAVSVITGLFNGQKVEKSMEPYDGSPPWDHYASVIIVGDKNHIPAGKVYYDNPAADSGYVQGSITKNDSGEYQYHVQNLDNDAFGGIHLEMVSPKGVKKLDIINPVHPFGKDIVRDSLDAWTTFSVSRMHVYDKEAANGSIGSVLLEDLLSTI